MSIVKRIKREARKNPAKAALLAGLLGLALYCWAPLVWGWLGSSGDSRPSASAREETDGPYETPRSTSRLSATEPEVDEWKRPSWKTLQEWHEASPWTVPAQLADLRDPFHRVASSDEVVKEDDRTDSSLPVSPKQSIDDLKMNLTGTIVGPRRRVALLDGRAYREGDVVHVEQSGSTWELEIRRIEANRVVLGWHSVEKELKTPERPRVGRIELVERSN